MSGHGKKKGLRLGLEASAQGGGWVNTGERSLAGHRRRDQGTGP